MAFDVYNAILFKVLAERKDIQDTNRIMLVAGMTEGSPLTKMLIPFQMVQQAEELSDINRAAAAAAAAKLKLESVVAVIGSAVDTIASDITQATPNIDDAQTKLNTIKQKIAELNGQRAVA